MRLLLAALCPPPLPPAPEIRARAAFFSHYVFGFSRSHGVLAALYQGTAPHSPLSAAVDAAALLFLAKHYQVPGYNAQALSSPRQAQGLTRLATASYMVATNRLSSALRAASPILSDGYSRNNADNFHHPACGDDEILQAVLLLDLYEKLAVTGIRYDPAAATSPSSIDEGSWMSHIRGALSLLRASDLCHHLESPVKRRLAARLAMTMVISCGAAGVRVPRELAQLRAGLAVYFTMAAAPDPKFAVTGVVVGVVNLAADVGQGSLTPDQVRHRTQALDRQFIQMEQSLPPSWEHERIVINSSSEDLVVYGGHYDLYADHFVTQVRNVVRSMRLLLAKTVMGYGESADLAIETLCDDIAASVPQFTWAMARPENSIPFGPLQSLQCFTLLSPMYLAGQMTARLELREWIIATMEYMAESGGLHMAKLVAGVLRDEPETSYWHVYAILGSYAFAA
ncbi:hypothetical protein PG996_010829 [Apiospora saccharicola]|uniref:C6 transcription factor n=1 Tax=Apiospora saccharicola TaxID=335842 RepID=A0ABR1UPQ7_9PEZI